MDIREGTQVHHRRYPWMVGDVMSYTEQGHPLVNWHKALATEVHEEKLSDLRATPRQPIRPWPPTDY